MSRSTLRFVLIGAAVALVMAFGVSQMASSKPDGLEKVAATHALDADEQPHAMRDAPMADYAMKGVDGSGLSTGVSGVIGVAVTFGLAAGVGWLVLGRRSPSSTSRGTAPGEGAQVGA